MQPTPHCLHCDAPLSGSLEQNAGELVVRCPDCDRLNVLMIQVAVVGLLSDAQRAA